MADYTVTITIHANITASTDDIAEKRGETMAERAAAALGTLKASWMGDIDECSSEVEAT